MLDSLQSSRYPLRDGPMPNLRILVIRLVDLRGLGPASLVDGSLAANEGVGRSVFGVPSVCISAVALEERYVIRTRSAREAAMSGGGIRLASVRAVKFRLQHGRLQEAAPLRNVGLLPQTCILLVLENYLGQLLLGLLVTSVVMMAL